MGYKALIVSLPHPQPHLEREKTKEMDRMSLHALVYYNLCALQTLVYPSTSVLLGFGSSSGVGPGG